MTPWHLKILTEYTIEGGHWYNDKVVSLQPGRPGFES